MSTTPGRRRPPRAEVRRTLLEAAARVFARAGIDAASLEEVAAEAGLTKGAIYSNFAGKDDLVEAVVAENLRSDVDLGLAAVEAGGSMVERAQALGDELTRSFVRQPERHMLFLELWQREVRAAPGGQVRDDTLMTHRRDLHDTVTAAIAEHAADTGAVLPMPPEQLATVLLALSHGFAIELQLDGDRVPDDLFGQVLALLVRQGPTGTGAAGLTPGTAPPTR
ncbi:helix-turn-helix domain-containing protein [Nocardioides zeae]|uniref:Helix-turn-helix domain-containing protein n=1 Tax=Nocardioides imazamoxiresistens TaxID=3231893 RepID=A0ABU3PXV9_9ACTN|nr:helix-turn-helix domain-containing protein [Nocardioides zeae]MDT9594071.1 helix-turn-helix domain-containing protein [Nocardioides zeae]